MLNHITPYIADRLTQHLEPINSINCINYGGCGLVALSVYEKLSALGYNARIVSIDSEAAGMETTFRHNGEAADAANHYAVRVGGEMGFYFDSHGARSHDDLLFYGDEIKPIYKADLEWMIANGGWNSDFYTFWGSYLQEKIWFIKNHISNFKIGNNQARARSHRRTGQSYLCS